MAIFIVYANESRDEHAVYFDDDCTNWRTKLIVLAVWQWSNFPRIQAPHVHRIERCERCRAFSETGRSTNSIAWKRLLLWNNWLSYFSGRKQEQSFEQNLDGETNWSGIVNFHCMQKSLVMSMRLYYFRRWLKWRAIFIRFPWVSFIYTRSLINSETHRWKRYKKEISWRLLVRR